ncbi:protein of unknown function [Paraburkholderia dioscoreae]|uniref:Uncharacterized protein n=1 Tax=Paraburkholderia dioscoreae TaxID=2604047 RepID=A0A5Q4ZKD0_9BURK|nr:protein of unknown function [Paraburkholderia dioscoreae]
MNKTEPNPGKHDCRAKNAIQTRAAGVMQRNSREAAIVQAAFAAPAGAPPGASWSERREPKV